jgi:hypothetical protein
MLEISLYIQAFTVIGVPIALLSLLYLITYVLEDKYPVLKKVKSFCKDSCINLFFLLLICCFAMILFEVSSMLWSFIGKL